MELSCLGKQNVFGEACEFVFVAKHVFRERAPESEFVWEAPVGTRVLASRLRGGRVNFFCNSQHIIFVQSNVILVHFIYSFT